MNSEDINIAKNNKQIAKNTLMLYIRMFLIMGVSLYTSRIILRVLGVEDFGIYNVVASIVVLFSFIQNAMTAAIQRFLNFELGKGDLDQARRVFSSSIIIYAGICLLIFIFAETVGLWFLKTQLNIPEERTDAAYWVYQVSIFAALVQIIQMPYNASIIAFEKMSFYALISIIEVILRLLIVFILYFVNTIDKLKLYSLLVLIVSSIVFLLYYFYCRKKFTICSFKWVYDSLLLRRLLGFSGWSLFGSLANVGLNQGVGFILNIFYGVLMNASLGIANQVGTAVNKFISSFQIAFNPQIVKIYAVEDFNYLNNLILRTSKYSFYLMLIIVVPLLVDTKFILGIWLGEIPQYAVLFSQITLLYLLIDSIAGPFWMTAYASGRIRVYQIIVSCLLGLNLLVIFVLLKIGFNPTVVIFSRVIFSFIILIFRIIYVYKLTQFKVYTFMKKVMLRIIIIVSVSLFFIFQVYHLFETGFIRLFVLILFSTFILVIMIYFGGLNADERFFLSSKVQKLIKNKF